ncbi:MAG: YggS family pyridoxal phosphate-dependent enzyme [Candidatus Gracilibacteria bacterium]|jgi:hypothetical protein
MTYIKQNIDRLKNEIPSNITIMVVTKGQTIPNILKALNCGIDIIGENRIQEAREKFPHLPKHIKKHLIGHLQTNKTKEAVELFDLIESVDSEKLAHEINKQAGKFGKKMPIFIQVNISREPQKSGILEEDIETLIKTIKDLPYLELKGLMAIAEDTNNLKITQAQFSKMQQLKNKYNLEELSMGMSQDYKEAIKHGSTQVRLGSAIFDNLL